MNRSTRIAITVALAVVIAAVLFAKTRRGHSPSVPEDSKPAEAQHLPRLVDVGSVSCIPCKMMAPILDELRQEYARRLQVEFIDVQVDRQAAMKYGIQVIPTQVFLSAEGEELFRHEGFFS